ncbi:MAG: transketolase C-terminal domain-containing protein [Minisyncoccia bacterium]
MLNTSLHLHEKIFDEKPETVAIRIGFGDGLVEAAKLDERIVGLCADLTESTRMHLFKEAFPKRFVQVGIAEQNLAATAAGMAAMGKIPFISSYAMFSPGRNWEQIRTTACYNNQPVKVIGSHAGISVGPDGGTHQAVEDVAIMRVIPRMNVIVPCDSNQARLATLALAKTMSPTYLRLAREKTALVTTLETPFEIGKAQELWRSQNPKVAFIAMGALVHNTLLAAKKLDEEGIGSVVLNIHTIKPIDADAIISVAKEVGCVVSVEEHQIMGGLGSAIAEILAQHAPTRMHMVGVKDEFGQSGTMAELLERYEMTPRHIIAAAKTLL